MSSYSEVFLFDHFRMKVIFLCLLNHPRDAIFCPMKCVSHSTVNMVWKKVSISVVECIKTESSLFSWEWGGEFVATNRNKQLLGYQYFHTIAAVDYRLPVVQFCAHCIRWKSSTETKRREHICWIENCYFYIFQTRTALHNINVPSSLPVTFGKIIRNCISKE